jgi:hypothetical protein
MREGMAGRDRAVKRVRKDIVRRDIVARMNS